MQRDLAVAALGISATCYKHYTAYGFAQVSGAFYSLVSPTPTGGTAELVAFSPEAAKLTGLDPAEATRPEFAFAMAGATQLPGSDGCGLSTEIHAHGLGPVHLLLRVRVAPGSQLFGFVYVRLCLHHQLSDHCCLRSNSFGTSSGKD